MQQSKSMFPVAGKGVSAVYNVSIDYYDGQQKKMVLNRYLFQIVEYIQKLTGYNQVSGFSITPK